MATTHAIRRHRAWPAVLLSAWLALHFSPAGADDLRFNRDIRPLLSDACFQCHGPDAAARQADLRLDVEASAKGAEGPIVPGDIAASELIRRIMSDDPELRMPPAKSGKRLSPEAIEKFRRWIAAGAPWEKHWAFVPPVRPALPEVRNHAWPRNAIDTFVLARIESARLAPSPEADRATLLRRATFDLTGLPPTPEEVDALLADSSPDAYERAVDRLLASPRYGERMAGPWLDAARYADTSGYQTDGPRVMWRWRDWVIEAFNRNQPFDEFTVEQIAGDLLPNATLDQRVATGFHRNCRGNSEGGIIPEEYEVEYAVDRVDTTATVWLGLTAGCARCHDHKFDPISQEEYYRLFAFFNNIPERGRHIKVGNTPPFVPAPTRDQQAALDVLAAEQDRAAQTFAAFENEIAAGIEQWAATLRPEQPLDWGTSRGLVAHFALDDHANESAGKQASEAQGTISFAPGRAAGAAQFDGSSAIVAGEVGKFGYFDRFTLAAWIRPAKTTGTILARMSDQPDAEGYSIVLVEGKLQVNLIKRWLDDAIRVESVATLPPDTWHHVAITYDGSREARGVRVFVDGAPLEMRVLLDELNQSFSSNEPFSIAGGGAAARFTGAIDDVRIYNRDLKPEEIELLACGESIDAIARIAAGERSAVQAARLRACYLETQAPRHVRDAADAIVKLEERRRQLAESFPTVMVMEERPQPRETFVLVRGQYDKPGQRVEPGVPASLPSLAERSPPNRLALARWLVDRNNPLAARVAVNRFWQSYFGAGLVKTVDDFGAQGDPPSHPELLDWLAVEFMDSGWDVKHMQRLIVTSAVYRQSSAATPAIVERDPENRLLARGPRLRLPAAAIRDTALAAAGLLVEHVGGPSVKPYQPPGLWKELTGGGDFEQDHGADLYRRSLYTFWKRTIAPPSMITFDASAREACAVRETRTNTPLQALALLNEITYVEAARVVAARAIAEVGADAEARLARMFRLVVSRPATPEELAILAANLKRRRERFERDPDAAAKLVSVGESTAGRDLPPVELAAYTAVANLIFNLDEVVTKE